MAKTKKPTTYAEYKTERDAATQAREQMKVKYGYDPLASMLRVNVPSTPATLRQQFFKLRYEGVSLQTIQDALDAAYPFS